MSGVRFRSYTLMFSALRRIALSDVHPIFNFIEQYLPDMVIGVVCLMLTVLLGAGAPRLRAALKRRRGNS